MAWIEKIAVHWNHWDLMAWAREPLPGEVLDRFNESQETFEIRFFEDMLVRLGDREEIFVALGELYTRTGRYREGLAIDRRLVTLRPRDSTAFYNLACSYSLLKEKARAFTALKRAIELGYRDLEHMAADPDLENLRSDPRWNDLLDVVKS
jgi:tetratricopeptide (TPR) repeat protein